MTRLVVMGGGLIGRRHIERIQAHPQASVAALVDPDPSVAHGLDVPRVSTLEEVAGDIDGIIVATPTDLHADHTLQANALGWPALIEKPVAHSLDAADAIIAKAKVPVLIGHHRRHHPKAQALTRMLEQGAIGQPITASLIWAMRKPDAYFEGNWRTAGGSPVMINLVHDLDLIRYWFGEITDISALPGPSIRGTNRVEAGAALLRCASGTCVTISFADNAPSPWGFEAGTGENPNIGTTGEDMMWITGTTGGISFPSLRQWTGLDWSEAATASNGPKTPNTAPLDAQLDHFLEVIGSKAAPLCTLQDGRAALAAALEIERQLTSQVA